MSLTNSLISAEIVDKDDMLRRISALRTYGALPPIDALR